MSQVRVFWGTGRAGSKKHDIKEEPKILMMLNKDATKNHEVINA
jgi:hypothetical protein